MIKLCAVCKAEKNITEFRRDKTTKDGRQFRCKPCARAFINSNYAKYKLKTIERCLKSKDTNRARIWKYKQDRKCSICSESVTACLDFHHTDPTKKSFNVASARTLSWETIEQEINKCILVCKNCHVKIHTGVIKLE